MLHCTKLGTFILNIISNVQVKIRIRLKNKKKKLLISQVSIETNVQMPRKTNFESAKQKIIMPVACLKYMNKHCKRGIPPTLGQTCF